MKRQEGFVVLLILGAVVLLAGGVLILASKNGNSHHNGYKPRVVHQGPAAPIPEPSSWAMMLVGGAVVGYFVYKKR